MGASRAWRKRALSRDVLASAAGAAVYSLAMSMASVAVPLLAIRAGYSDTEIGVLTAVSAISQMATRMLLGRAMRRWPDWTLVAAAGLLLAVANLSVALSAALVPFVVAQLLQGVARACFWTGTQTHVVRGPGRSAGALATVNFISSIGLLSGPVIAGLLSERTPVVALGVATAVALLGVVPTVFLDRLPPFAVVEDPAPGRLWQRPGVDLGCWGGMTAGAWRGLLSSYVPVALAAARQSTSTIGALVTVANAAALVGSAAAGRVRQHLLARAVLLGMLLTGMTTALLAAFASHLLLSALVLGVSGATAGLLQVLGLAVASDAVRPEERGDAIAVSGTFRAGALFAAPLTVAGLVAFLPIAPAVAVVGAAMTVPALVLRRRASVAEVTA